jgi:hypothetical protein
MTHLNTVSEVIAALGGIRSVAALTGRTYNAAANWSAFGRFPANTYVVMRAALEAGEWSAPNQLWGMPDLPVDQKATENSTP